MSQRLFFSLLFLTICINMVLCGGKETVSLMVVRGSGVWVEGGLRTSTCLVCFLRARARTPLSVRLIPHVVLVEKKKFNHCRL